jgi:quaternary ammonium compound-resistance protein SugE
MCEEKGMNWLILVLAGLFEVAWAIGLKYSHGFTRFWPSAFTIVSMLVSITLLGVALKSLPVGTAYSVWVGVGAIGTAALGIILFDEPANAGRIFSMALILAGIIGIKLSALS